MKTQNKNSGFTLVELIVVVTILIVLSTIGFLSLSSYSADSRNTKRITNISTLLKKINSLRVNGIPITSFVTPNGENQITSPSIAGSTIKAGTDYTAGSINFTLIGEKAEKFNDELGDYYPIGASTKAGGVWQIAATIEQKAYKKAYIKSNYQPRSASSIFTGTNTGTNNANKFRLTSGLGVLKIGDTVKLTSSSSDVSTTITDISYDLKTLTLAKEPGTNTQISLAEDESKGLIKGLGNKIVIDGGDVLPY